jgi:hypothetical protein
MEIRSVIVEPTSATGAARPHPPLDLGSKQIRLLSFESHGNLRLETFDESNRPKYVALSYEWGPQDPVEKIQLNCFQFVVRSNLYLALAAIQSNNIGLSSMAKPEMGQENVSNVHNAQNGTDYYWVDALWIDQNNIDERGHQVGIMADIYHNAIFVIVWLGPGLDEALKTVEQWGVDHFDYFKEKDMIYPKRVDLDAFFHATYWTRMWVLQEFLLARDILLVSDTQLLI